MSTAEPPSGTATDSPSEAPQSTAASIGDSPVATLDHTPLSTVPPSAAFLRRQRVIGGTIAAVAVLAMTFLMARDSHTAWGVGLGLLSNIAAAAGLLGLMGAFREVGRKEERRAGPHWALGPEPIVFLVGVILLLPAIRFGLWDPWETHYGEVAREILCRDDWISLWWQDEWFWSKPILLFWMMSLSMAFFGVDYHPDGGAHGHGSSAFVPITAVFALLVVIALLAFRRARRTDGLRAAAMSSAVWAVPAIIAYSEFLLARSQGTMVELALRLPVVLWALSALSAVAWAVKASFGNRAALLAGLVLATMPYFFLLAHQAITDMPFVATMTIAMCLLLRAWTADSSASASHRIVSVRGLQVELSLTHAVLGGVLALALPQLLYLATRHLTVGHGLSLHADVFYAGSAENGALRPSAPFLAVLPPALLALLLAVPIGVIVYRQRFERRARATWMLAFYLLCTLSLMAKGLPGVLLPGLIALGGLVSSRRWGLLRELRLGAGTVIVVCAGMPWYVAMFVRHGPRFTDRLLIHDHINRLAVGVHGDTGSVQYFVAQLGYGTFPWIALALPALVAAVIPLSRRQPDAAQSEIHRVVLLWFALSFALFSLMVTKFHHYILPAVPPLAILIGIALDSMLEPVHGERTTATLPGLGAFGVLALVVGAASVAYATETRPIWSLFRGPVLEILSPGTWMLLCAAVPAGFFLARFGATSLRDPDRDRRAAWAALAIAGVAVLWVVGRDLADTASASRPKGYERLIHLFVYNYSRAWPNGVDFSPALAGFAFLGIVALVLLSSSRLRHVGAQALVAVALASSLWTMHVYIHDLTPHWSQQRLVSSYYKLRRSTRERLVAWQMNWKGENLYSGGRALIYVSLDNDEFERWLSRHHGERHFFILERGRLANLRRILGKDERSAPIVDDSNNKFVLVRAVL